MKEIAKIIKENNNFLIVSHSRPDGDSISSMLALYSMLNKINKNAFMLNDDVPLMFSFLKDSDKITKSINGFFPDVIFYLDCANKDRIGRSFEITQKFVNAKIINVDHHLSNEYFGDINFVDIKAASTCEMILSLAEYLNFKIDSDFAECILTGLITDTGFFKFSNVSDKTLRIAADMITNGADIHKISYNVYMNIPLSKIKLISRVYERMEIFEDKAISYIKNDDFTELNAKEEFTDGIVNQILYVQNVKVAVLAVQDKNNVRISFRSKTDDYDMNILAGKFKGGGHKNASGAYIHNTNIKTALNLLTELMKKI